MTQKIYIHIGLHKTATRFLQRSVFVNLDQERFNYNPRAFTDALYRYLRKQDSVELKNRFERLCRQELADPRHLVISLPDISGDMYNSHENAWDNLRLMQQYFPEARALYFVRRQSDWLQSAYRQSIQKGVFGPIEVFLNFYDGEFQHKTFQRRGGMRNVEAYGLRLFDIYKSWAEAYGEENVYLVRYEDFRGNRARTEEIIAEWLQIDKLPPAKGGGGKRHNRSFSALAIQLFCGGMTPPKKPPKGVDQLSTWQKKYSPVRLLRNLRRIFIRKVFDRIIYRDWDLLARGGMREKIDRFYEEENRRIEEHARR